MTEHHTAPDQTDAPHADDTPWQRLASAAPIRIRDPLAEVLGMVPDGEPLVVTFADVAKSAGHACPAVAGAYRGTQLALDHLYPDEQPVRSNVEVTVDGAPDDSGLGPMANVIRHVTGAADETGFTGFGGFGGRENLLEFGDVDAASAGRSFRFERTDTGSAVVVGFDPSATGVDSDSDGAAPMQTLPAVVSGDATDEEVAAFRDQWHDRVQRVLDAPADGGPFTVEPLE